jgi:hypothetical protein
VKPDLYLAQVRRAMTGGATPSKHPETPEEHAQHAVFWTLYELEHVLRDYAARVAAGAPVRLCHGVSKLHPERVDFTLRIVEDVPARPAGGKKR